GRFLPNRLTYPGSWWWPPVGQAVPDGAPRQAQPDLREATTAPRYYPRRDARGNRKGRDRPTLAHRGLRTAPGFPPAAPCLPPATSGHPVTTPESALAAVRPRAKVPRCRRRTGARGSDGSHSAPTASASAARRGVGGRRFRSVQTAHPCPAGPLLPRR